MRKVFILAIIALFAFNFAMPASAVYVDYWTTSEKGYYFVPLFVVYDPPGELSYQKLTITYTMGNSLSFNFGINVSGFGFQIHCISGNFMKDSHPYYSCKDNIHTNDDGDRIFGSIIYGDLLIHGYTRYSPMGIFSRITSVDIRNSYEDTETWFYRYQIKSVTYKMLSGHKVYINSAHLPNRRGGEGYDIYGYSNGHPCTRTIPIGESDEHTHTTGFKNATYIGGGVTFSISTHGVSIPISFSISSGSYTSITFTSYYYIKTTQPKTIKYYPAVDPSSATNPNVYNIWNYALWIVTAES